MPAVTMSGAMIRAMLAAYRRTLEKTMAQARSMEQVVDQISAPVARNARSGRRVGHRARSPGLIEDVLKRSLEDVQAGAAASAPYFPVWYQNSHGASFLGAGAGGVWRSGGGLFSDSAIPDIGGMMSSLGTIGNSPSSSGGGGGGFGGGGSGGGGERRRSGRGGFSAGERRNSASGRRTSPVASFAATGASALRAGLATGYPAES